MEDSFYYMAFLYILYQMSGIVKGWILPKEKEDVLKKMSKQMPEEFNKMDDKQIQKTIETFAHFSLTKTLGFVISIFAAVWLICGYLYTPESYWFLLMIILVIGMAIIPPIALLISALREGSKNLILSFTDKGSELANSRKMKFVGTIETLIQIALASYIINLHFNFL